MQTCRWTKDRKKAKTRPERRDVHRLLVREEEEEEKLEQQHPYNKPRDEK